MNKKYGATLTGAVLAVFCFATTWTFVPVLTMMPVGVPLEQLYKILFPDSGYGTVATGVLITLVLLFLIATIAFIDRIEKTTVFVMGWVWGYFIAQLFIIHPLVFYIWATVNAEKAGDGQFIFGIFETFPVSSVMFVFLGFFIDHIKNKSLLSR